MKKIILTILFGCLSFAYPNLALAEDMPLSDVVINECTTDLQCPPTSFCLPKTVTSGSTCLSKRGSSVTCTRNEECKSNNCQGAEGTKTCVDPSTGAGAFKVQFVAPTLEINIPTLKPFTTSGIQLPDAAGYVYFPFLGQYIAAIFRWSLLIAGTLATVIIIFGGLIYMTSGGNAQRTKDAKERMAHALLGLILLLASYTILYVINPDLVSFKSLKVQIINRIEFADDPAAMKTPKDGPACTGENDPSMKSPIGAKTYLGQLDTLACGTRAAKKDIKYIVLHEGARTTASTVNVFKSRHVSSHYSIDRDGTIDQLVGEEKTAWHAGAINQFSIGIDLSIAQNCPGGGRTPECTITDQQYEALKKLIPSLVSRTGTEYSDGSVIGHCQVTGTDHIDPRNFDWSKIGLNNSAHYTDPTNFNSKCKIVFDWATYKQTYLKEIGTEPFGCCGITKEILNASGDKFTNDPFQQELTEKQCTAKENQINLEMGANIKTSKTWFKGSCYGYGE